MGLEFSEGKYQANETTFYTLSYRYPDFGEGLGTGTFETNTRFLTEEGRGYYKQALRYQLASDRAKQELEWFKKTMRSMVTETGRVKRKQLLTFLADLK